MDSLKSVYNAIAEQDFEKEAQAQLVEDYGTEYAEVDPELVKQAADYDHIGRILAHNVFTDLVKEAMDEDPDASEDEKKKGFAAIMAKAKGEAPAKDEKKDEKKDDEKDEESEKTAAYRQAVLERMYEDPEYVQALIAKHF